MNTFNAAFTDEIFKLAQDTPGRFPRTKSKPTSEAGYDGRARMLRQLSPNISRQEAGMFTRMQGGMSSTQASGAMQRGRKMDRAATGRSNKLMSFWQKRKPMSASSKPPAKPASAAAGRANKLMKYWGGSKPMSAGTTKLMKPPSTTGGAHRATALK